MTKTEKAIIDTAMRMFKSRARLYEPPGCIDYSGTYYILRDTRTVRAFTRACAAHIKIKEKK